jgi:hypothetical protein
MAAAHEMVKASAAVFGLRPQAQTASENAQKISSADAMMPVYFVPIEIPQKIPNNA